MCLPPVRFGRTWLSGLGEVDLSDRQTDRPDHYSAALKAGLKQEVSAVGLPWEGAGS